VATRLMAVPRDGERVRFRVSLSLIAVVMGKWMMFAAVRRTSCGFAVFMVLMAWSIFEDWRNVAFLALRPPPFP
jgi:hypothetical protein